MKNIYTPLLFILSIFLYCCSPAKKESTDTAVVQNQGDTSEIVQSFLYGLWSMDSGNALVNEGFYIKNDGSVDFVSDEVSGSWELKGIDSLKIQYDLESKSHESGFHIDSLSDNRMVLSDSEGWHVYRKVPFGMNYQGNVVQGFSGYISPGQKKEYSFELPPAKKVSLRMTCPDSSVTFRVFDDRHKEITSTDVRSWSGIIIRSGKYKLILSKALKSKWKEDADFDIKVMVF